MSSNSKDGEGIAAILGAFFVCGLIYWAAVFVSNGAAWVLSNAATLIDCFSKYPMVVVNKFGINGTSLRFDYAIGWFVFFGIIGSMVSLLIAHVTLPTTPPAKAFDERRVLFWESAKQAVCIILFLLFVIVLRKY